MPGRRSGGAVSRKRLRSCSRSQAASSCRYHISPSGHAELEQAEVVDRQERVAARVAVLAEQALDRVVVGDQRRDLRVGDPLEQRRRRARRGSEQVVKISTGSGSRFHSRISVANPVWSRSMSPGSTTTSSAAMISWSVSRSTPRQSWPRWWARSTSTPRPCTPWNAMCSSPRCWAKQRWPRAVARGVVGRADQVDAGAVAVVVDGLLDAVAVGVELGADVGERVPLGRVLQREGHHVVGPHVDVLGVAEVGHLAHVDVVEDAGVAVHVLGRRERRRVAAAGSGPCRRGSRAAGSGRS